MATTGDLANLSHDVYRDSGAPTGWTRLEPFSGSGGEKERGHSTFSGSLKH